MAIRESPKFSGEISQGKTEWPRCLLWHGWLPSLSGNVTGSPWAVNPADDMFRQLESSLGFYCPDMIDEWPWTMSLILMRMPPSPNTWSDGSKIQDPVSKIETAGAEVFGTGGFPHQWRCIE